MSTAFEFVTATRIRFGQGSAASAATEVAKLGSRAAVIHGANGTRSAWLTQDLEAASVEVLSFTIGGEPSFDRVRTVIDQARQQSCDVVVSIGGGSVIDTGKAVAALLTNDGDLLDYVEGIGRGKTLALPAAPFIAIPTTAGTGAEVTKNAVLGSTEHGVKVSLRSTLMLPTLALVDPELTSSLPPHVTATTGLDAVTQLLEAYTSKKANPMTDAICREGLSRAGRSLLQAVRHGDDVKAREDMALASLFSGLALANAGLGAAHGFAGPLGGRYDAPHGALCARLLPYVVTTNVTALLERDPAAAALEKYENAARLLLDQPGATVEELKQWLHELCDILKVPGLATYGLDEDAFPEEVEKAKRASSMRGNPIELTDKELTHILRDAL